MPIIDRSTYLLYFFICARTPYTCITRTVYVSDGLVGKTFARRVRNRQYRRRKATYRSSVVLVAYPTNGHIKQDNYERLLPSSFWKSVYQTTVVDFPTPEFVSNRRTPSPSFVIATTVERALDAVGRRRCRGPNITRP